MSCRTSAAGSALTTFARLQSGLSDVQTLSAFHDLRGEAPRNIPAPTEEQWRDFIVGQQVLVSLDESLTQARRASLMARLERARSETPDGRTWFALRNISDRAERNANNLTVRLQHAADALGVDVDEVRSRYTALQADMPRTRRGADPEGYTAQMDINAAAADLPTDRGSVMALHQIERQALRARADRALAGTQRIVRADIGSGLFVEAGYDPDGGRLELVFRSNPNKVYAYRGVPQHVWDQFATGAGSATYNTHIRGRDEYRYPSQEEADLDSAARRCGDCGQFAAAGHHCPPRIAREEATAAAARAAVAPPEPVAPVRPDPRFVRWRTRRTQAVPNAAPDDVARYDRIDLPVLRTVRASALDGPITFAIGYSGGYRRADPNGLPDGRFDVEGRIVVDRPDETAWSVTNRTLRCNCPIYRNTGDCPHIEYVLTNARNRIVPAPRGTRAAVDPGAAQAAVEEALRLDWTRNEAAAAEAARTWAPSAPQDRYSENFAAFEADMAAAIARKEAGQSPVEYQRENATGGLCTPESGRAFGVELEFAFEGMTPEQERAARAAIGRDLHAAGLTPSPTQRGYHAQRRAGYTSNHQGGWSYEIDGTVAGEIVSPVMYDTPETWENLAKVCEIIKRHGGKATTKTGSHVHVSTPRTNGGTATELVRLANQHEDVLYRVSANPERGTHRPLRWCGPNRATPPGGYRSAYAARPDHNSHHIAVNLQSVDGSGSDHAELRHWDGSLDPAVIQAQVKISAAMVAAAQRISAEGTPTRRNREPVGTHAKRVAALRGRSRRELTREEVIADSATARSLADTLFTRREDKAQFAALYASTTWVRSSRQVNEAA